MERYGWLPLVLVFLLNTVQIFSVHPDELLVGSNFQFCLKSELPEDQFQFQKQSVLRHGLPVKLHKIVTDDGYILTAVRIPNPGKPPVLIMHGLFGCSADYLALGMNFSLAALAYRNGFDVWLGNNRGNTFSRDHVSMSSNLKQFWQFSFHEMGVFDLPAMIDFISRVTQHPKVHYIGHSQGTTQFLVLNSLRPEYNDKFYSVHLSSPVAFLWHMTSPVTDILNRREELEAAARVMNTPELGNRGVGTPVDLMTRAVQSGFIQPEQILMNVWYYFGYHNSIDRKLIPEIMKYSPAGASIHQLIHYAQLYRVKDFQQYDYGNRENMRHYGVNPPSLYPLHYIRVPMSLYYSDSDPINQPEDVEELVRRLPGMVRRYKISYYGWNHIDFLFGFNAHHIYREILESMRDVHRNTRYG
ncbi:lipase 3-like [Uranotaenia lowii]|uniref:lipase 3-like n=1 Tax=Uranotaenia lowii TaxID=190385 RepID=UPI00247AC159|nr:lipase 3-like [Uranotaenia lowii]